MDRKNYDKKTIGLFDTIGSYFVDIFYNDLYLQAMEAVRQGRANNITDRYRINILNYMRGIASRDDLYKKVIHQLHEFYQKASGFGAVVLSEFEDRILSQFIPREYYHDFTDKHKDKTLREIIIRTVNELGEFIVSKEMLYRIIDNHMNKENVAIMQDRIVDVFIIQREDYYIRFINEISKSSGVSNVNKNLLDKLQSAWIEEKKNNCSLKSDKDRAVNIIRQLIKKIDQQETEITKLKDSNKLPVINVPVINTPIVLAQDVQNVHTENATKPRESELLKELTIVSTQITKEVPILTHPPHITKPLLPQNNKITKVTTESASSSDTHDSEELTLIETKPRLPQGKNVLTPSSVIDDDPWNNI